MQASLQASGRWHLGPPGLEADSDPDMDLADDAPEAGHALVAGLALGAPGVRISDQLGVMSLDGLARAARRQRERANPAMTLPDAVKNVLTTVTQDGVKALPVRKVDRRTAKKSKADSTTCDNLLSWLDTGAGKDWLKTRKERVLDAHEQVPEMPFVPGRPGSSRDI